MAAGHLVARLQMALDGQIDLDHFEHAGRQLVALGELLALFFKGQVKHVALLLNGSLDAFQLRGHIVIGRTDVEPVVFIH